MYVEKVYESGSVVTVPKPMGEPRADQMQGTEPERLMEVCGRACYDSMGSGRASGDYHKNLLMVQRHYSVAEHAHVTIETDLHPMIWLGIPDVSVVRTSKSRTRLTLNMRHILEWPDCITLIDEHEPNKFTHQAEAWRGLLSCLSRDVCPNIFEDGSYTSTGWNYEVVEPVRDTEAFVSLFLEDSRVWSHEQVRHRGNMSQRSGRFVDETDRAFCIHPHLRDYLNELGYLPNDEPLGKISTKTHDEITGESLFDTELSPGETLDRVQLGNAIGSHTAQGAIIYTNVVEALQPWLVKKGMDQVTARKQARSAARYYLGNGISTEMIFTASIRHWRHIFEMRLHPSADAAIRELMEHAQPIVAASQFGALL